MAKRIINGRTEHIDSSCCIVRIEGTALDVASAVDVVIEDIGTTADLINPFDLVLADQG